MGTAANFRLGGEEGFRADARQILSRHYALADTEFQIRRCAAAHFQVGVSEVQLSCVVSGARVMVAFPVRDAYQTVSTRVVFL